MLIKKNKEVPEIKKENPILGNIYSLRGVNKLYFKEQITHNVINMTKENEENIRNTIYAVSLLFYIVNKDSDYINYFLNELQTYQPMSYDAWEEAKERDINEKNFATSIAWDYFNEELKGRVVLMREEKIKKSLQDIEQYINEYVKCANIGNIVHIFDQDLNRWIHDEVAVFSLLHSHVLDFDPNTTTSATKEILARILVRGEQKVVNNNAIAFNNCVFDFEKRMQVSSTDTVAAYNINLELKPSQTNVVVDEYFYNIMGGKEEYVELLWHFIADVVNPMRVNNYFWWFMSQNVVTGKSTLMRVIANAIGDTNFSGVTFSAFTNPNNRSAIGDLYGKLLNIDSNVGDANFTTETLKAITNGDVLYVDLKDKTGVNLAINTTLVALANCLPNNEMDENIKQRCIVIPLEISPTEEERINFENNIKHLLLDDEARSYIVNKALEYTMNNNSIVIPNQVEEEANDSIDEDLNFINELLENYVALVKNTDGAIAAQEWFTNFANDYQNKGTIGTTGEIFDMYVRWCTHKDIEPNSKEVFITKLRSDKRLGR